MSRNLESSIPFAEAAKGYLVVQADGDVDECSDAPVHVAIVVDVSGYGPHTGSMYVDQNRYHGSSDSALESAYEMHEEWMRENYSDHLKDLEKDRLKEHVDEYLDKHPKATREDAVEAVQEDAYQEADEWFRENMDAVIWKMTATEFLDAIEAWPEKYRKCVEDGVSITTAEECD
jgi:hypothetical protein